MPGMNRPISICAIGALFISLIVLGFPFSSSSEMVYSNYVDPLDAGSGARALGMGKAFVAAADDVNSIFFNPAGLAYTDNWGLTCGGAAVLQKTSNANFATFFSIGTDEAFGIGYIGSGTTTPMTSVPTRELSTGRWLPIDTGSDIPNSYSNSVAILSYGTRVGKYLNFPYIKDLSVGFSVKGFFQQVETDDDTFRANGFDMDLGMIYKLNSWLKFGLYGQNVLETKGGGKFVWTEDGTEEAIPADCKGGISLKVMGKDALLSSDHDLYFNLDADQSHYYNNDLPVTYHAGIEWQAIDALTLRCGVDQLLLVSPTLKLKYSVENDDTAGIGYNYGDFSFDYAYHQNGDELADVQHYVSVSYAFGSEAKKQKMKEAPAPAPAATSPEAQTAPVALPGTMPVSEESLSNISPADKTIIYTDSVPFSSDILNSKVAMVTINGNPALITPILITGEVTGEAQRKAVANINIPACGKVLLKIKSFDVTGLPFKEYDIRLIRLPKFSDVPDDLWAHDNISALSALNIFLGFPDGTFKPDKTISRAEMTSILVRTSGFTSPEPVASSFKDVASNNWASFSIKKGG